MAEIQCREPEGEEQEVREKPDVVRFCLCGLWEDFDFHLSEMGNDWNVLSRVMTSHNVSC